MPPSERRHPLVTGPAVMIFVTVAVAIGALLMRMSTGPQWYSAPDQVRPWAEAAYRHKFDRSPPLPWPRVDTYPEMEVEVLHRDNEIELIAKTRPHEVDVSKYDEVLFAGSEGRAVLPDGTCITLEAAALQLPNDVEWTVSRNATVQTTQRWVNVRSGKPVPAAGNDWAARPLEASSVCPRLFLKFRRTGQTPMDWSNLQAFDARTHALVGGGSASASTTDPVFYTNLAIWHQTPLRLGLQIVCGPIEDRVLPLIPGGRADFGPDGYVEILEVIRGSGTGGVTMSDRRINRFKPSEEERIVLTKVWPPELGELVRIERSPSYDRMGGSGGFGEFHLLKREADATEIRVARFSKVICVVFDMPSIPRLPEVRNLLDTPVQYSRMIAAHSFLLEAASSAELRIRGDIPALPDVNFPIVYAEAGVTPAKLLLEYERLSGKRVFLDRSSWTLSLERPPGLYGQMVLWWNRNVAWPKIGWSP